MIKILRDNSFFVVLTFIFLALNAFYQLRFEETDATFFFGAHRSVASDFIFCWATRLGEVPMFALFTLLFLFFKDKKAALKIVIVGFVSLIFSAGLKVYFQHPRPVTLFEVTNPSLLAQANLIKGFEILRGGNSFPSGHTTAAFALYGILAFHLPKTVFFTVTCFLLAAMVGISRIYVVAHFPKDVFLGTFLGLVSALLVQFLLGNEDFIKKSNR